MSDKMLYIVRGLPGSGKSTLAETLSMTMQAPWYEEDNYLITSEGKYWWTMSRMNNAIELCYRDTQNSMVCEQPNIIVSNVFEEERMLEPYQTLAERYGYKVTYLVVENRRGGVNVHDVPQQALNQMRADFEVSL